MSSASVAIVSPGRATRPLRDGHGQNAPGARGEDGAFGGLLHDDVAIGMHGRGGPLGDVERGASLVELHLRVDAAAHQLLHSVEIDFRLIALRLLRFDA